MPRGPMPRRLVAAALLAALLAPGTARAAGTMDTLTLAGGLAFGMSYLLSLPMAFLAAGAPGRLRLIPVVGTVWGAACDFGAPCGAPNAPSAAVGVAESLLAVGQVAGLTLFTIGMARSGSSDKNDNVASGLSVAPVDRGSTLSWATRW